GSYTVISITPVFVIGFVIIGAASSTDGDTVLLSGAADFSSVFSGCVLCLADLETLSIVFEMVESTSIGLEVSLSTLPAESTVLRTSEPFWISLLAFLSTAFRESRLFALS